ncbi:Serine/threonine-protein kinase TAO3 [Capsicum annuum]|nr:Serine/threonine-protein kinase TAO3 [Capsicum annuum]
MTLYLAIFTTTATPILNFHPIQPKPKLSLQLQFSKTISIKQLSVPLSATQPHRYTYPDPITEFAVAETQKFRAELLKKLSKEKEILGDELDDVVSVCAEVTVAYGGVIGLLHLRVDFPFNCGLGVSTEHCCFCSKICFVPLVLDGSMIEFKLDDGRVLISFGFKDEDKSQELRVVERRFENTSKSKNHRSINIETNKPFRQTTQSIS